MNIWKRSDGHKQPRHLAFIRKLPCAVCGTRPVEAAHVRLNRGEIGKMQALGQKPPDRYCVPLCTRHHREDNEAQHIIGEKKFWRMHRIDPLGLADAIWSVTGDNEAAEAAVFEARRRFPWKS